VEADLVCLLVLTKIPGRLETGFRRTTVGKVYCPRATSTSLSSPPFHRENMVDFGTQGCLSTDYKAMVEEN